MNDKASFLINEFVRCRIPYLEDSIRQALRGERIAALDAVLKKVNEIQNNEAIDFDDKCLLDDVRETIESLKGDKP